MTTATFILVLIGTVTGCLLLLLKYLTYRRDCMKLQLEAKREEQLSEPFFKWGGGRASHASANNPLVVYRAFIIEGGAVTELTIKADGDIQSEISPKSHLGTHGTGEVKFSKIGVNFIGNVTFEIHYTTRLNKRSQKSFFWPANGEPTEIKD